MKTLGRINLEVLISVYRNLEEFGRLQYCPISSSLQPDGQQRSAPAEQDEGERQRSGIRCCCNSRHDWRWRREPAFWHYQRIERTEQTTAGQAGRSTRMQPASHASQTSTQRRLPLQVSKTRDVIGRCNAVVIEQNLKLVSVSFVPLLASPNSGDVADKENSNKTCSLWRNKLDMVRSWSLLGLTLSDTFKCFRCTTRPILTVTIIDTDVLRRISWNIISFWSVIYI